MKKLLLMIFAIQLICFASDSEGQAFFYPTGGILQDDHDAKIKCPDVCSALKLTWTDKWQKHGLYVGSSCECN